MTDTYSDIALAVAFYRKPADYSETFLFQSPLTRRTAILFQIAVGRQPLLDHYSARCLVAEKELQAAAQFFIERLLALPRATHYQVLGVDRDASMKSIKANYQCLMQLFHPDKAPQQDNWSEGIVEKINRAYGVLRNPGSRCSYDESLCNTSPDKYAMRFQHNPIIPDRESFADSSSLRQVNAKKKESEDYCLISSGWGRLRLR